MVRTEICNGKLHLIIITSHYILPCHGSDKPLHPKTPILKHQGFHRFSLLIFTQRSSWLFAICKTYNPLQKQKQCVTIFMSKWNTHTKSEMFNTLSLMTHYGLSLLTHYLQSIIAPHYLQPFPIQRHCRTVLGLFSDPSTLYVHNGRNAIPKRVSVTFSSYHAQCKLMWNACGARGRCMIVTCGADRAMQLKT